MGDDSCERAGSVPPFHALRTPPVVIYVGPWSARPC